MIISKESNCAYTIFDSLEYICDCCNKSLMVTSMEDLREFNEIFDIEAGHEEELLCWNCSENDKIEEEMIKMEIEAL